MAPTYELISSQEITSSVSSVTFSNIPQTYTDLVFWASTRASVNVWYGSGFFRLNDSGQSSYNNRRLLGSDGSMSAPGDINFSANLWGYANGAPTTANFFSPVWLLIPNYRSSVNKTTGVENALLDPTGSHYILATIANKTHITGAITQVQFVDPTGGYGNTLQYSTFRLYGILKA
jgi:hypothetical protein